MKAKKITKLDWQKQNSDNMLKMATFPLNKDLHLFFEVINDSLAEVFINLPGIVDDIVFHFLHCSRFVPINIVF